MNGDRFLLLESENGYWTFFKELVSFEQVNEEKVREFVSLDFGVIPFIVKGFKEKEKYFFKEHGETIHKEVFYYLVEFSSRDIRVPVGYLDNEWLCYQDAMRRLSFKNTKEVLEKAGEFISNRGMRGGC